MNDPAAKLDSLRASLRDLGSVLVAFSAGVDSTFLLRVAHGELGVRSPLREAGLAKAEIRALSRELGLPTADKPSAACLASRTPYGDRIDEALLARVGRAEDSLRAAFPGLGQLRVRSHAGGVARIEVSPADIPRLAARAAEVFDSLRALGFAYVALDLRGYRTGSLNETLAQRTSAP